MATDSMIDNEIVLTREEMARVDGIIRRLRSVPDTIPVGEKVLERDEVEWLIKKAQIIFQSQPMLLEIEPPLTVCGDTHGQLADLQRIFGKALSPPKTSYLFLGDYVDRGPNGVEVICLMFAYKVRYWNSFHILRGNHETAAINRVYGFYDEVTTKYDAKLYKVFNDCFDWMPIAALIAQAVFCMHGGISPHMKSFDDVRKIKRPLHTIDSGLPCDLLWADPDPNVKGYVKSTRGVSYLFGADAVLQFCHEFEVALILRAHQVVHEGYQWFAGKRLATVFSAPDYCNVQNNNAGILMIDRNMSMKMMSLKSKTAPRSRKGSIKETGSTTTSSSKEKSNTTTTPTTSSSK